MNVLAFLAMLLAVPVGARAQTAPSCLDAASCDDANACTVDACAPDGCVHAPLDLAGLAVAVDSASGATACANDAVPPLVGALVGRARANVERAATETNPTRTRRDLKGVVLRLRRAARKTNMAGRTGRIGAGCAADLGNRLQAAIDAATCLVTPPTNAPFACLSGSGPLLTIRGTRTTELNERSLAPGARIDARAATFLASPAAHYPITLDGGAGVCLGGGTIKGQYERTLDWSTMHDMNNAGVSFASPTTVDGVRVDDVTDGLRPRGVGPFTIRESWLSYIRDDCVENDHLEGGVIDDSLFDGCYVGVSERPSDSITADGRDRTLTIQKTLIRLQPMPGPRNGTAGELGNGELFKWSDQATRLALYDDVFLVEKVGQGGPDTMGVPPLAGCRNDVMVWLGDGDYPAPLPSCFTVTHDRKKWDDAVAAWKASHPFVGR